MGRDIDLTNESVDSREDNTERSDRSFSSSGSSQVGQRLFELGEESRKRRARMVEEAQNRNFLKQVGRASTPSTAYSSSCGSLLSDRLPTSRSERPNERTRDKKKTSSPRRQSGGVHNRLYARSKARQEEGKEKRKLIEKSLAPKPIPPAKKISAKKASSLYDRLYYDGVQKQISLGRKKNAPEEEEEVEVEGKSPPLIISNTEADNLYKRLYNYSITKQIKDMKLLMEDRPKVKVISSRQADSLYERLYGETTLSVHRARAVEE